MQKTVRVVGCVCLCLLALYGKQRVDSKNLSASRIAPPVTELSAAYESDSLRRFSLGFDHAIADLLWVRLLQTASHSKLVTPGVSWEYAQLNAITDLDRNHTRAYHFGSAFLSVFRQDKVGAKNLLGKWTRNYPTLWQSHYLYGFHLYSEMQDYAAASKEILLAASLPGSPNWLHSLGVRLMTDAGSLLPALHIALTLYPSVTDDDGRTRLRLRIRSIRYHLQKKQWENALAAYRGKKSALPGSLADLQPFVQAQREVAQVEEEGLEDDELRELVTERFRFRYSPEQHRIEGILGQQDLPLEVIGTYHN